MILTCHFLVGAAIAEKTKNPFLGLFFAFLSHFVLDVIPHIEYSLEEENAKPLWKKPTAVIKITADFFLGVFAALILAKNPIIALLGGVAGTLPDALSFLSDLLPVNPVSKIYREFHIKKLHFLSAGNKIPNFVKIGSQVLVFLTAAYFLYH